LGGIIFTKDCLGKGSVWLTSEVLAAAEEGVGHGAACVLGPVAQLQHLVEVQTAGAIELLRAVVLALAELEAIAREGHLNGQVARVCRALGHHARRTQPANTQTQISKQIKQHI
jgi:hypothetical protein